MARRATSQPNPSFFVLLVFIRGVLVWVLDFSSSSSSFFPCKFKFSYFPFFSLVFHFSNFLFQF